jgi:hypothetical protein
MSTVRSAFTWFPPKLVVDDDRFVVYGEYTFLLLRYITGSGNGRPYLATLCGPAGRNMLEDAPVDHLHHHGVWWGHGDINGVDCYLELPGGDGPTDRGAVVHAGWESIVDEPEGAPPTFGFVERVAWHDHEGSPLLDERRSLLLQFASSEHYTVDLDSTYTATRDVVFGDTKESVLPGIRVAEALTGQVGGTITSSRGTTGEEATMGEPAHWIDLSGSRNVVYLGESLVEGLACFDHPANPGHPQRFFTRTYGPISPFPGHHFHDDRTLAKGKAIRLRHRLVVHVGGPDDADVEGLYQAYAREET